ADQVPPPVRNRKLSPVRYFEKPEITLYRMGREVTRMTGEHGSIDLRTVRVQVFAGRVTAEGPAIDAARIALNLGGNQVVAEGAARIEADGIILVADRVLAPPSLVGAVSSGHVTRLAKDREAADRLMSSRL